MVRGGYSESSAGYGGNLQAEVQAWVEQVTGEPFEGDFADGLRDGVRLCKLLNTIKPSSVRRVNPFKEGQKFKQMENISNFIRGCRAIGVPEYSLFETVDLYEGKDVGLVVKCLHALGGTVQKNCPEFGGPHLGLKPVSRTPPRVAAAAPAAPAPPPAFDRTTVKAKGGAAGEEGGSPPPPPPYNGTAQRWGSSETRPAVAAAASPPPAYRDDVSSRFTETVRVTGSGGGSVSPRSGGGGSHSGPAANGSSRQTAGSKSPPHRPAPAYGGAATGSGQQRSACPQSPARSHNKPSSPSNGVRQQVPGAPRAVSPSAPPAPLPAATATTAPVTSPRRSPTGGRGGGYGLDAELAARREANYDYDAEAEAQEWIEDVTGERFAQGFEEELKDGRKLCLLINRIKPGAVRRVNDSRMPFKQMENVSNFLKACRAVGVAEHSLFETVDLYEGKDLGLVVRCLHALGQTVQNSCPEYNGPRLGIKQTEANKREWTEEQQQQQLRNSSGAMSNLLAGSSKTMERATIIKTGATFGAEQSGTGDRAGISGWTMGSANTMDRSHIAKSGPTFGAEYAGTGNRAGISGWTMGSANTMDRSHIAKSGPTFGAEYAGDSGDKTGASSRLTAGHRY